MLMNKLFLPVGVLLSALLLGCGGGGGGGVVTTTKAITQTTSLSIAIGNGGTAKTGFISGIW